ncbi:MAG: DUF4296 domain-containing protein [Tidjanibacter sp.]|nr:DUF4296 domain-containing protein [Tidjanibacter sp.]
MKHVIRNILFVVAVALVAVGCSKSEVIPDRELEKITREMFLVNAYAQAQSIRTDSLDIYTPILEKYGYTQDDFFNTLANFQKRKSARLSDVIESTIASLESMANGYEQKLRNLNYIDSLAKAMCAKEVMSVDKIRVRRLRDTAKLVLSLPIRDVGEYVISYNYHIDTLDKNTHLQSTQWTLTADSVRNHYLRTSLTHGERKNYKTILRPKTGATEYFIQFADYAKREDKPYITIDSLRITYIPPSEEALAHMDSVLSFKPNIVLCDSVEVYGSLDAVVPMLSRDSLAAMEKRAKEAAEAKEKAKKRSKNRSKKTK